MARVTAGEIDDVLKNPYSGVGSGHEHDAGAKGRWSGVAIRDSRIASHLPQITGREVCLIVRPG